MYNTGTGFDQTNHNTGTGISNFKGTFNGPMRAEISGVSRNVHTKYLIGSLPTSGTRVTVSTGLVGVTYLTLIGLIGEGNNNYSDLSLYINPRLDETNNLVEIFYPSGSFGEQYRIKIEYYA